jgi:hypothetical protein
MDVTSVGIWVVLIGLALFLLIAIASGRMSGKGSSAASITAFHDLQSSDKQNAIQVIVEQKAGKKLEEQKSGEGTEQEETTKEEKRQ